MIKYRAKTLRCLYTDPKWLLTILEMYCFRQAFLIAFCGAILAGGLWLCDKFFLFRLEDISDVFDPAAYTAFVWFLSTLIVFRTSHSYNRFWEGTTLVHQMTGHLTDMTHVVVGFTRYSKVDAMMVHKFRHVFVRLVSLLHAMILADLEGGEQGTECKALQFELLDLEGFEKKALVYLELVSKRRDHLPLLVNQWINNIVIDNTDSGVLSVPPPLLARVFQSMNQCLLSYHEARKYGDTPFPFPYTVGIEIVLSAHFVLTPLFVCLWTTNLAAMCSFSFVLLFPMWLLHLVPNQLENPFEPDLNGLDTRDLQEELNHTLTALLSEPMGYCPKLRIESQDADQRLGQNQSYVAFTPTPPTKIGRTAMFTTTLLHKRASLEQLFEQGAHNRTGTSNAGSIGHTVTTTTAASRVSSYQVRFVTSCVEPCDEGIEGAGRVEAARPDAFDHTGQSSSMSGASFASTVRVGDVSVDEDAVAGTATVAV